MGHPCGYAEAVEVGPGPVAVRAGFGAESRVILNIAAVSAVSHTRLMRKNAIVAEQDRWDRDMRASAARELTELACEWRESADEEVPEITEESFARRIELRSIAMDADGSFSAYFDDDDMFFGHCVTAYGTLANGVTAANMEG